MKRVAIGSIFRNSEGYVDRYFSQVADLAGWLLGKDLGLHLILVEGDSTDNTWELLKQRSDFLMGFILGKSPKSKCTLLKRDHGGPVFGSIDNDIRWRNISYVCNELLGKVSPEDDALIYVESDLIWDRDTMLGLLAHLPKVDAVAPMCFHRETNLFYDTWGHRKDGVQFRPNWPYHLGVDATKMTEIDSAGSCIVMNGDVARGCRFTPPEQGIVGFGNDIKRSGHSLWLDPKQKVLHP